MFERRSVAKEKSRELDGVFLRQYNLRPETRRKYQVMYTNEAVIMHLGFTARVSGACME